MAGVVRPTMVILKSGVGPGAGSTDCWVGLGACCANTAPEVSAPTATRLAIVRLKMGSLCPEGERDRQRGAERRNEGLTSDLHDTLESREHAVP